MSITLHPARRRAVARGARAFTRLAPLALAMLAGACALKDLTEPPKWDVRLNIPSKSTSISVGTMLPSGVSIVADSSAFAVTVGNASVGRTLGSVCSDCTPLNGLNAPKPAFNFTAATTTNLPTEVSTATLASGSIAIVIQNGFSFDPINVAGSGTSGWLVIVATDANNRQLARDSVNGATTSLPASGSLNRTLTLLAGALKGPITLTATMSSPAGGSVAINTASQVTVTGTPQNIRISGAAVTVSNKTINASATEFDLSDVDSAIRDRLMGGKLQLTIGNPFAVTGNLTLTLQGGGSTITKTLALASGNSTPTIDFTQGEMRTMAGKKMNLTISGPVTAAAPITVAPKDKVTVSTRLELTVATEAN